MIFAKVLSWAVGRPVIDATGITGRFDFHLEFALDENTPPLLELRRKLGEAVSTARPTILTAIQQQYGLRGSRSRSFLRSSWWKACLI